MAQQFLLILEVMQGICHHNSIERRQGESAAKVGADAMNVLGGSKSFTMRLFQIPESPLIFIHRIDIGVRTDQLAQSQRERARARAEVRPGASGW